VPIHPSGGLAWLGHPYARPALRSANRSWRRSRAQRNNVAALNRRTSPASETVILKNSKIVTNITEIEFMND
jgi:hypothetical protein